MVKIVDPTTKVLDDMIDEVFREIDIIYKGWILIAGLLGVVVGSVTTFLFMTVFK